MAPSRRALVTGGSGFVGSHLCEKLLAAGHEVVCLDNLVTGHRSNVAHLAASPHFSMVIADVVDPVALDVDTIFNLACPASPIQYQKSPIDTLKTNVMGAANMLELARNKGARIFQASTSEVYGDALVHPQKETYWGNVNSFGPRACYDEGKRCAETLFYDYHHRFGVDIRIARIFNTYGPRMNREDGRVVSNFVVQALTNEPITIYGDGSQTRSFCYVDDLVSGITALMSRDDAPTSPVNLGNPAEFTVRELADLVVSLTGSRSPIIHLPLPLDDPRQRRPDISLARSCLDWAPRVQPIEGLVRTIAYFDSVLSGTDLKETAS
ncbi:MAG: SDR family oxidoreductase [Hyphomicrobiales bacterium]|nr:MAG: SDR family oxidoreductase [Hyphomicrobiales bacterium]